MVKDTITLNGDDWLFSQHQVIDLIPSKEDIKEVISDYLSFKVSQLMKNEVIHMKYEKYKLNELAKIEKVKGKPLSKYEEGETPYVTGSQSNNGVVGYINAPKKDISKGNCIVVDPIKGLCMYQGADFVGRGFSGASINALYIENMDEISAMFIIAAIKKVSLKIAHIHIFLIVVNLQKQK